MWFSKPQKLKQKTWPDNFAYGPSPNTPPILPPVHPSTTKLDGSEPDKNSAEYRIMVLEYYVATLLMKHREHDAEIAAIHRNIGDGIKSKKKNSKKKLA